jgi:hypothetical protein
MRQRLSMLVVSALALASPMFAQFNFTDFSGAGGSLYLNGNAAIVGTALRLVPASSGLRGSAYYYQKQHLSLPGGWTTTFRFQITNPINGGADGFSFIIQDAGANALGSDPAGGAIGYTGIPRSLAVEFDTWHNPEYGDPNGNHVAVHTQWQQPNSVGIAARLGWADPGFNLEDGQVHTATITYNGSGQLDIVLDNVSVLTVTFNHNNYLSILDASGFAWVGFTAATGGAWEDIDILSWSFTPVPEPASCVVLGTGLLGLMLRRRRKA